MFLNILSFELQHRAKKLSTYIYFALFIVIGYFAIFSKSWNAGAGNLSINAPFRLYYLITTISHIGLLVTAAFFGSAAYRDFKENIHSLYFTYPIKKFHYLAGRFSGAMISTLFVFSGIGIGLLIAYFFPLENPDRFASMDIMTLIQPYLIGVFPNILLAGAVFFSFALLTRKIFPVYVGGIIILMGYLAGLSFARTLESDLVASLIDPFGLFAARSITNYWAIAQKNLLLIPLSGNLLLNRILWSTAGLSILFVAFKKFHFSFLLESANQRLLKTETKSLDYLKTVKEKIQGIQIVKHFNFKNYIRQINFTTFYEFKEITNNIYFLLILLFAIIFMFVFGFKNIGLVRGAQTYPVTYQVLGISRTVFYLFHLIIIIFCSGELVWSERDKKMQGIFDTLPIPEWVPFLGKLGALMLTQVLLMLLIMACGIIIQTLHGYYNFELGLYIKELFGMRLIFFLLISVMAMFIQVIINHKYLGHFLMMIVYFIFIDDETLPSMGLEHNLYRFAGAPKYYFSEMVGYGHFVKPIIFFNLYWIAFSILLVVFAILFWMRGNDTNFKERIMAINSRITKAKLITAFFGAFSFLGFGSYIYYNTNVLNEFEPAAKIEKIMVDYEKKYKQYENLHYPRMTDLEINVDIYPYQRKVNSAGKMVLRNRTNSEISEIFIQFPRIVKINRQRFNVPATLKESSKTHGCFIYNLINPMKPGASIELDFDLEIQEKGFKNSVSYSEYLNLLLVENGTIIDFLYLIPSVCYDPYGMLELSNNDIRQEYGLLPKERIASIDDDKARMFTICKDADWMNFEAIVSTVKDQTALTSGELQKEWFDEDRHYFHYKAQEKIYAGFPIMSAKYCVKKDQWQNIGIEVYYHKGHEYNIELMIKAIKKSLEYYTKNFSPYQYNQVKIVEYPRYKIGAESYANLIPVSEGYGFIAKFDKQSVDYVFRVTAHEVGHQWWGDQVVGANVEGMFFLLEGMTQYFALMVTKNEYDQAKINKYLKKRIKNYLRGRARETEKEVPLAFSNMATRYLNYEKSIVVMNALQDYIGEDNLNTAIRKYIEKVAYQGPPYTTSLEFLQYVNEVTPDSLKYIITDMFKSITLYDNKAVSATYQELENSQYLVNIKFKTNKIKADEIGNEIDVEINDLITFGAFDASGKVLYLKKHWIDKEKEGLEFIVDNIPEMAGIDPYYYLIDKNIDDNVVKMESAK